MLRANNPFGCASPRSRPLHLWRLGTTRRPHARALLPAIPTAGPCYDAATALFRWD
jgi:hypothetical protein